MANRKRILFLARWYPSKYDPMDGLFVEHHAQIARQFDDVAVIFLHAVPDHHAFVTETATENNVYVVRAYYLATPNPKSFFQKIKTQFRFAKAYYHARKIVFTNFGKPDLIHVHVLTRLGIFALIEKIKHKIPYVVTEHWSRYLPSVGTYSGYFRKQITKQIVRCAQAISTPSINLQTAMKSHHLTNSNWHVLPNAVDTNLFNLPESRVDKQKFRFLHVSCFDDFVKNISGILRVVQRLSTKRADFECVIVGTGFDFDAMVQYAQKLGIQDSLVKFTGLLEGCDLATQFRNSDCLVMFSFFENMPVVINEAFACGKPVISTYVGGISEYVNTQTGVLIEVNNETQLEEQMNRMIDNYANYDPAEIRAFAMKNFSEKAVEIVLKKMYQQDL